LKGKEEGEEKEEGEKEKGEFGGGRGEERNRGKIFPASTYISRISGTHKTGGKKFWKGREGERK